MRGRVVTITSARMNALEITAGQTDSNSIAVHEVITAAKTCTIRTFTQITPRRIILGKEIPIPVVQKITMMVSSAAIANFENNMKSIFFVLS